LSFSGLSLTSVRGNSHATTYRALLREFVAGTSAYFGRDVPWYACRDLPARFLPRHCMLASDLETRFRGEIRDCDWAIVSSYVPEGVAVGLWAIASAPPARSYDAVIRR